MAKEEQTNKLTVNFNDDFPGEVFSWTTHPVKKRPLAATLVTSFILIVSLLIFFSTNSQAFTYLALLVLFASLAKFYLPTKFKMTDEFVFIKSTTQTIVRHWSDIRSYYPDKNGVLLSPFSHPSRLENFRGIYLIYAGNKTEIIDFIKAHINMTAEESADQLTTTENEDNQ